MMISPNEFCWVHNRANGDISFEVLGKPILLERGKRFKILFGQLIGNQDIINFHAKNKINIYKLEKIKETKINEVEHKLLIRTPK